MLNLTQKEWVENLLIENGKITRNTCLKNYISRLGAIIAMLKDDGYEFETQYVEVKTPFGTGKDFEYKVVSYPANVQKNIGAEKVEPAQNGKVAHIEMDSCTFCDSNKIAIIADVAIKDDIQINHWYVECQQCLARGSRQKEKNDAIYMWNKTPQYVQANQDTNSLFDIDYIANNTKDGSEIYKFKAKNDEDARHWVINHLDLSKDWNITKSF